MKYLEEYGKLQEAWLSKITNDISKMKQTLPYYCNTIQINIALPKDSIYVGIDFHRTLNNNTIATYEHFNQDLLFKKAAVKLTYNGNTYYNILRYYNEKWRTSKQSQKILNNYLTSNEIITEDKNSEFLISLGEIILSHLNSKKPKTNKQVLGYIAY